MAFNPPWVNFKLYSTRNINSTPTLIFGSQQTCMLDTIFVVNTTKTTLILDIKALIEKEEVTNNYYLVKQVQIPALTKQEILNNAVLYLEPGDTLFANSDFSGNTFDCLVSYREFTEI